LAITVEREVKFPIASWQEGEAVLGFAEILERRYRETNSLFDFPAGTLRARGQALRLRRARGFAWLTFKEQTVGPQRVKERNEYETTVADPEALVRTLGALGMTEQFRYEKYRQVYSLGDLEACLDETPIGCYIELEGPAESIETEAARLGFSMSDAILLSYPALYVEHRRRHPEAPEFMVFIDREISP
jgi:adenylate cyclase, class 2